MLYLCSCDCSAVALEVEGEIETDPKGNPMAAVNVRCLEDIDLASIPVTQYDGRLA